MLRQKKIFLQPAFHSYPKILFLPIFLGCQNKWKCFIVINGVLVTQWMLLGIQLITEDDIFRKPHHILFWLYADMLNFGKKVMKFSQLHRHACVHIDTRVERERDDWWFCSWKEISLQRKAPLLDTCWMVDHHLLQDGVIQGLALQEHPCGQQGHPVLCGTVWTSSPCREGNDIWRLVCSSEYPLKCHLWEQKEVPNASPPLFSLENSLGELKTACRVLERGPQNHHPNVSQLKTSFRFLIELVMY